jgi:hypothetical protein
VIELGCFDAKTIDYLPAMPELYYGLDANWNGGLNAGRERWREFSNVSLSECYSPDHLPSDSGQFDTVICMETLEHLPPDEVGRYLDWLADVTGGMVFITVPNEIGGLFLAKWIAKAMLYGNSYTYSWREFLAAVRGRSDEVERNQHKGFDYRQLIAAVSQRFEILQIEGMPIRSLPLSCAVTICIIATAKSHSRHPVHAREARRDFDAVRHPAA